MKYTTAFSMLFTFPAIHAVTLPRSEHDGMLQRNFKNVLQDKPVKTRVVRSPQGPASNPGEFTNVGLSNSNPANQNGGSGSNSNAGSNYVPQPVMDDSSTGPTTTTPEMGSISSGPAQPEISSGRHHPRPTGHHTSHRPRPTGHHRHRNGTGIYIGNPELIEVELEVEPDGEVVVEETLWQFNGTGWNSTEVPLPSNSVIGTLVPVPMRTSTPVKPPQPASTDNAGAERNIVRPGFTGPEARLASHEMTSNEIANDGTGANQLSNVNGHNMVVSRREAEPKKRWLRGIV
ncbi:hypothetical protein ACLMJK_005273 [Lecanora helva]